MQRDLSKLFKHMHATSGLQFSSRFCLEVFKGRFRSAANLKVNPTMSCICRGPKLLTPRERIFPCHGYQVLDVHRSPLLKSDPGILDPYPAGEAIAGFRFRFITVFSADLKPPGKAKSCAWFWKRCNASQVSWRHCLGVPQSCQVAGTWCNLDLKLNIKPCWEAMVLAICLCNVQQHEVNVPFRRNL